MSRVHRRHRRRPPRSAVVILHVVLSRRVIAEVVIATFLVILLLVEIGLRWWPGSHPVAHVAVGGVLFGLIAAWVYVNRAALAAWEQQDTEQPDQQGERS